MLAQCAVPVTKRLVTSFLALLLAARRGKAGLLAGRAWLWLRRSVGVSPRACQGSMVPCTNIVFEVWISVPPYRTLLSAVLFENHACIEARDVLPPVTAGSSPNTSRQNWRLCQRGYPSLGGAGPKTRDVGEDVVWYLDEQ